MSGWAEFGFGVLAFVVGAAVTWGVLKTKIDEHEKRLESYGRKIDGKIDRTEFETRHQELIRRIERIEK